MPKDIFEELQINPQGEPKDIFAEQGISLQQSSQPMSGMMGMIPQIGRGLMRGGQDILAGLAQMGEGIINAPHNLAKEYSPGLEKYIPKKQEYDYSKLVGIEEPTTLDEIIQGAAKASPYALAAAAGGIPAALLAGGAYGATQSTEPTAGHILATGAEWGLPVAGLKLGGAAIKGMLPATAKKIGAFLSPKAEIEGFTPGAAERSRQAFAQQLDQNFKKHHGIAQDMVGEPLSKYGNNLLVIKGKEIPSEIFKKTGNVELGEAYEAFNKKPTINNAFEVQKKIGEEYRNLQSKWPLDSGEREAKTLLGRAREQFKENIYSQIEKIDSNAAQKLKDGLQYYYDHLAPYYGNKTLRRITNPVEYAKETNPSQTELLNIFKNPTKPINNIIKDLGTEGKHNVLLQGVWKEKATPKDLLENYRSLGDKGLASYITPEASKQFSTLENQIKAMKAAKWVGGIGSAAVAGHYLYPRFRHYGNSE